MTMTTEQNMYLSNMLQVVVKYANVHLQQLADKFEQKHPNEPICINIPNKCIKDIVNKSTKELLSNLAWAVMSKDELGSILSYISIWMSNVENTILLDIQYDNIAYNFTFKDFQSDKFQVCVNWEIHICHLIQYVVKNIWNNYILE